MKKKKENNNHTFVILAYKESTFLEECIKSVINQTVKTNVVIATSTRNSFIEKLAKKYSLEIIENKGEKGIANDFNFALTCTKTPLVTIAHQDDIYENTYAEYVLDSYNKYSDSLIITTDYFEIRSNDKVYNNKNLKIKRFLLSLLKLKFISNLKFIKRSAIRFGNSICCPSITYCMNNLTTDKLFISDFTSNMDWLALEKISKMKGRFTYIHKFLMGHRVHEDSTTTKIINDGKRSLEDYEMFCKFWPRFIAKILTKLYKNSEKSNNVE